MKRLLLLSLTLLLTTATFAQAQRMPITTTSDAARVHYVQGEHATGNVDFERARAHFDAALAADPGFAMAHVYRAILSGGDERDEHVRHATAHAAQASEAERQMIESYAANLREDHDREATLLTTIAERFPSDPMPMFWWANTESNRGNHAEAVAAARRALAADPSFAPAYNLIGYAEVARGDLAAAEQAFRDYIRLAPDEANPYDSFGEFYLNQGKLDEAEKQYEMALTKDPEFTNARAMLVRIAVMQASEDHIAALNRQDTDAFVDFFTASAVESPSDGSQAVGREAIRENVANFLAAGEASVELVPQEIQPMGDGYAYQRAGVTMRLDGAVVQQGIISRVWVETDDGWKIARDTWTSAPVSAGTR
ncbi:MAG: tetratricopeptide repeat protein [Rhodothermales bacterium]